MFSDMKENVKELVLEMMYHNSSITVTTIEENIKAQFEQLQSIDAKIRSLETELKSLVKLKDDSTKIVEAYQAIYRIKKDLISINAISDK